MVPDNHTRNCVGEFLFLVSFKSYDYFSRENACFIKIQSLTAGQKQVRQLSNQNFLTEFVRRRCHEDIAMLIPSSPQIRPETNSICEPLYFGKQGAIFGKPLGDSLQITLDVRLFCKFFVLAQLFEMCDKKHMVRCSFESHKSSKVRQKSVQWYP